jgi:hypothetical protein
MKGTPAPRKELKRLERCGSVEAGIIIAIMSTAHDFPKMGISSKIERDPPETRAKRSKEIPQVDCDIWNACKAMVYLE